ncbi:MAG: DoxX protein [Bacteroidota bacterium]
MNFSFDTVAKRSLAIILLLFGFNGLFPFLPPPPQVPEFLQHLMDSGYIQPMISIVMLLVGISLILNRWVPLALVLLAPLSVNIILYHLFHEPGTIAFGAVVFALNGYLIYRYREQYKPMLNDK